MKKYGVNELRRMFLEFFESKGHLAMKSFSLVPHNDKSLLLINSGMAPLKPYFTGAEIPPRRRVTTCQKCIRTGDIENVGKTARHGTFFEMLGNFSFGDYFKHEAIAWSWEFLTEVVGLDPDRLYPSVYLEDDEAFDIWNKEIGIPADRIYRFGKEDNFWEHGAGPCGPCSEIYYDRGEKYGCGKPDCTVGCDCDRYMEIWNNVFTQFDNDGEGHYTELEQKNIDTGMGLERLASVVQDVDSIFDVDTLCALRNKVCELAHTEYKKDEEKDVSIRLITDHIRSATFMISDGIMPTNEGRGYVLRRLIRRAIREAKQAGVTVPFTSRMAKIVIENYGDAYPELRENQTMILEELDREESLFKQTLEHGEREFEKFISRVPAHIQNKVISGKNAFFLYETYGFPIELTIEMAKEKGFTVDRKGYDEAFRKHQELSRQGAEQKFKGGLADHSVETARLHTATHLLHKALRMVLGDHVAQKGSNINAERLRFDFSHPDKMTPEQIAEVERLVNEEINRNDPVICEEMSLEDARKSGAIGLFGNKYGERVTVYSMGDFSKEICGGPHASSTGELGSFKIIKEESSSRGVRRIKAVIGKKQ